jgi:hypothetical protein
MSNLYLSKEMLGGMTTQELQELLKNAGEQGNAAPGWRNYLRFICEVPGASLKQSTRQITVESGNNLYRGSEFVRSDFMKGKGAHSVQSYISNIRRAMANLGISQSTLAEMNEAELQQLLNRAGEQNNCASAWRCYLNFLLNNEATPRASRLFDFLPIYASILPVTR